MVGIKQISFNSLCDKRIIYLLQRYFKNIINLTLRWSKGFGVEPAERPNLAQYGQLSYHLWV